MESLMHKDIPGLEEYYSVSSTGEIFSKRSKIILKNRLRKDGRYDISLKCNGNRYYYLISRLVAELYIPNPNNLPEVNHKDGNKGNDDEGNLEWCTEEFNSEHARDTGLKSNKLNKDIANKIRVEYLDGVSQVALANKYEVNKSTINRIINNKIWN
ncbi:HNH endonuclease [Pantoea phage vB_PagS_AAS21]|uniref:HNH endonuclease n=1 Tax=Pantoea phage vB_PagS_AAS21 TaxID=2575261 RepID=A0A4Y5P1N8_9CAUD|nr:HNH endonuclease [Pantoea phage vB_PagS_AAS21]